MCSSFCKMNQFLMISTRIRGFTHAKLLIRGFRSFSSSLDDKHSAFTLSFLVNLCGYSFETAKFLLEKVQLKNPKRPDDALRLFFRLSNPTREHKMRVYKKWGWSEHDLDFVLKNCPNVLLFSDKRISNTMDFFVNKMGYKSVDIARSPGIMRANLEKRIIPRCYVYQALLLKGLLQKEVCLPSLLRFSVNEFEERFVTGYTKDVPRLLDLYQGKITLLELGFTSEDVRRVKPPLFFNLCKSTLEHKVNIYKSWGLSENDVQFASRYYPRILTFSNEKISNTMDFLVNKMGYKSVDVVRNPSNLQYCLETRITPRCLVYKVLLLKGLLMNEISLSHLLSYSLNDFEERFITKYNKDFPQVLNVYQGKITLLELGFTSEDVKNVKGVKPSSFFTFSKLTREHKMKTYKSWGLSGDELDLSLKNYLHCSNEKLLNTMDFLVNKMGYKHVDVVRNPSNLQYSLETRIIPRCSVYKVLLLKGLLKKKVSLTTLLRCGLNEFEERFVTSYTKDVPRLLNLYQGKITLLELGFSSEDVKGVKPLPIFSLSKSIGEHKMKMCNSWGMSENEFCLALNDYPSLIRYSCDKISKTMDFLVNKMGYKSVDVLNPSNIQYCLETRIVPRCLVYKVLLLKGLLQNKFSLTTLLSLNDFKKRFVTKYKKDVPQLLNLYQGKITLLEIGFTLEDVKGVKPPPIFTLSNSTRELKMKIYKSWGLSDNELGLALKNYPRFFHNSGEKIANTMDFLVNKMGYKSQDVVRNPSNLQYCLETRIIPRCLVYKVLLLKGLLTYELSLTTLLNYSMNDFQERFVTRYMKDVPRLLDLYQCKITLLELGFTSEDVRGVKPLAAKTSLN